MSKDNVIDMIESIVYNILQNEHILQREWHIGVVTAIVSKYAIKVKVDGSTTAQTIPCNPNVTFVVGDNVFVHFVNGDSRNKFVPYKRATGTEA